MKTSQFALCTAACALIAFSSFDSVAAPQALPAPAMSNGGFIQIAATAQDAQKFIEDVSARGIGFLGDAGMSDTQRRAEFRKLLRASFDMSTIGKFALGTHWRTANPAQQAEYQRLFEKMIVETYARRFSDYQGQKLEVTGARDNGRDFVVSSKIIPADGGETVAVEWRVRGNKNGQLKIIDVIVEGVSMAMTQRSDFASVIQAGGGKIDVLLEKLRNGNRIASAE